MRCFLFTLASFVLLSAAAIAEETASGTEPLKETRIEVDDRKDVIRFFIKGKLAALLDESGLHVRENSSYGGVSTDYGSEGFDAHTSDKSNGHAR